MRQSVPSATNLPNASNSSRLSSTLVNLPSAPHQPRTPHTHPKRSTHVHFLLTPPSTRGRTVSSTSRTSPPYPLSADHRDWRCKDHDHLSDHECLRLRLLEEAYQQRSLPGPPPPPNPGGGGHGGGVGGTYGSTHRMSDQWVNGGHRAGYVSMFLLGLSLGFGDPD